MISVYRVISRPNHHNYQPKTENVVWITQFNPNSRAALRQWKVISAKLCIVMLVHCNTACWLSNTSAKLFLSLRVCRHGGSAHSTNFYQLETPRLFVLAVVCFCNALVFAHVYTIYEWDELVKTIIIIIISTCMPSPFLPWNM